MAVDVFVYKLMASLSLVLLSYSCGILLLAIVMRERPDLVRDVLLTPLARLGPYGMACIITPWALSLLLGTRRTLEIVFLMFILTIAPPLIIALIFSSLSALLSGLLRCDRRPWYPALAFLSPIAPGLYIMYGIISELVSFLPDAFTPLLAIFTFSFCLSGLLRYAA